MAAPKPKSKPRVDRCFINGLYHYAITFTKKGGFADLDEIHMIDFHRRCDRAYLVKELTDNGDVHYHSGVACKSPATANAFTKRCETLYRQQDWTWVTGVSVKVKKMVDFWGWMFYLSKDVVDKPTFLHGWSTSWIQEGLMNNQMKKPTRIIMKDRRVVKKHESVDLIIDYSDALACPITGKESYKYVIKKMTRAGYRFHNVRHEHTFQEVMCVNGDDSYLDRGLEHALQFVC